MNTKRFLCAALGAICSLAFMQAQVRTEQTFEKGGSSLVKTMQTLRSPDLMMPSGRMSPSLTTGLSTGHSV